MADYIRREDAVKITERYGIANGSVLGKHSEIADCITSEIENIPSADVAPVVHGRWINPKGGFWDVCQCSACSSWCPTTGINPNYCPVCGAKMDGGVDDGVDRR